MSSYADLVRWSELAGHQDEGCSLGLLGLAQLDPTAAAATLRRAAKLRQALFEVFVAILGEGEPAAADLEIVNDELERISPHLCCLRWSREGPELGWSTAWTLDRPLWKILQSAIDLLVSDNRHRVRQCEEASCSWLFVDETRNHSRRWCDMKVCGNRAKARRFRARGKEPQIAV